jgi:perosamine synthetase
MIEQDEIDEVIDAIKSNWITAGPKVKQFEQSFADYLGCKNAVAVNSGTAALHLALEAIGLQEGDEVITTPMTFAATAEVIRYFKAKPVFIDIDPVTMNIDTSKLEEYLTSHTPPHSQKKDTHTPDIRHRTSDVSHQALKAIIPVHFGGYPCDMEPLMQIARAYNLKVIEDAAHALPTYCNGKIVGTIGDITCFSFYATKNITTGEGGMIATDNDEWADRMRVMSLHGISKDAWKRYTAEGSWYYEIIAPGYKYNMTDIAAALGLIQLKKVDKFWKRRTEIAYMYTEAFKDIEAIEPPLIECQHSDSGPRPSGTKHSWHLYVIKLNLDRLTINRNRFIEELKERGIGTSVHFIPLHIHPYYRENYGYKPEDFPLTFETYKRIISLPIYPRMSDEDVNRVIEAVVSVCHEFRK